MKETQEHRGRYSEYLQRYYELLCDVEGKGNRVWPVRRGREDELLHVLGPAADPAGSTRADLLIELLLDGRAA